MKSLFPVVLTLFWGHVAQTQNCHIGGRRGQVQELKEGGATVAEWGLRLGDLIAEARWLEMPWTHSMDAT